MVLVEDALKAALVHRIATLVKRENLTQADAAKRMGITQPDMSKMLKGQFRPFSLEAGGRLCQSVEQPTKQKPSTNAIEAAGRPRAELARASAKVICVASADALHKPD